MRWENDVPEGITLMGVPAGPVKKDQILMRKQLERLRIHQRK